MIINLHYKLVHNSLREEHQCRWGNLWKKRDIAIWKMCRSPSWALKFRHQITNRLSSTVKQINVLLPIQVQYSKGLKIQDCLPNRILIQLSASIVTTSNLNHLSWVVLLKLKQKLIDDSPAKTHTKSLTNQKLRLLKFQYNKSLGKSNKEPAAFPRQLKPIK